MGEGRARRSNISVVGTRREDARQVMGANKGLMEDSFSELKAASSDGRNTKDNGKGTPMAPTCWENISLQSERKLYKSRHTHTHTPKSIYKGGKKISHSHTGLLTTNTGC